MSSIYSTLPPEVEHRISAWQKVRFRANRKLEPIQGPTITLSRQTYRSAWREPPDQSRR